MVYFSDILLVSCSATYDFDLFLILFVIYDMKYCLKGGGGGGEGRGLINSCLVFVVPPFAIRPLGNQPRPLHPSGNFVGVVMYRIVIDLIVQATANFNITEGKKNTICTDKWYRSCKIISVSS